MSQSLERRASRASANSISPTASLQDDPSGTADRTGNGAGASSLGVKATPGKRNVSSGQKFLDKLHIPNKKSKSLRRSSTGKVPDHEDDSALQNGDRPAQAAAATSQNAGAGGPALRRRSVAPPPLNEASSGMSKSAEVGERMVRSSSSKLLAESVKRDSPIKAPPFTTTTALAKEYAQGGSSSNLRIASRQVPQANTSEHTQKDIADDDDDDEDNIIDLSQVRRTKPIVPVLETGSGPALATGVPADGSGTSDADNHATVDSTNGTGLETSASSKFLSNVLSVLGIGESPGVMSDLPGEHGLSGLSTSKDRPSLKAPLIMTEDGPLILETPIEAPPGGGVFGRGSPGRPEISPKRRSSVSSSSVHPDSLLSRASTISGPSSTLTKTVTGSSGSTSTSSNHGIATSTSSSALVSDTSAKEPSPAEGFSLQRRPTMNDTELKSVGAEHAIPDLTVDQATPVTENGQGNTFARPTVTRSRSGSLLSIISTKSGGGNITAKTGEDSLGATLANRDSGSKLAALLRDEQNRQRSGSIAKSLGSKLAPGKSSNERRLSTSSRRSSIKSAFKKRRKSVSGAKGDYTSGEEAAFYSSDEDDMDDGVSGDDRSDHQVLGFAVASAKRNLDFHALFQTVPEDDYLIEDYSCALQKEILIQGRLYVSENHICFYANIFGWVTSLCIPFNDTVRIEKKMTALVIPNGMAFVTKNAKYSFASFLNRDPTYDLITSIWKQNHTVVAIGHSEEQGGELGAKRPSVDISRGTVDGEAPNGDTTTKAESQSRRSTVSSGVEPGAVVNDQSVVSHAPTKCACGKAGNHYDHTALDATFSATPETLFKLIFKSDFFRDFLENHQKLKEIEVGPWAPASGEILEKREYHYIKPLGGSIGPKQTKCMLSDEIVHEDPDDYYSVLTTTRTPDVPSGSSFSVKTRLCLTWAGPGSCKAFVSTTVEWTGKSWVRGIIEKSAIEGQKTYHVDLEKELRNRFKGVRTRALTLNSEGKASSTALPAKADDPESEVKAVNVEPSITQDQGSQEIRAQDGVAQGKGFLGKIMAIEAPSIQTLLVGLVLLLLVSNIVSWTKLARRPAPSGASSSLAGLADRQAYTSVLDRALASHERIRQEEMLLWSWLDSELIASSHKTAAHPSSPPGTAGANFVEQGLSKKLDRLMQRIESLELQLSTARGR